VRRLLAVDQQLGATFGDALSLGQAELRQRGDFLAMGTFTPRPQGYTGHLDITAAHVAEPIAQSRRT
jgi:hypothetical protein